MKLKHITNRFKADGFNLTTYSESKHVSVYCVGKYLRLILNHDARHEVDQIKIISVIGYNNAIHYRDTIKLIDTSTNLLSDLTPELRESLYAKINLGKKNKVYMNLDDVSVSYELVDNNLLIYSVIDNRT